MTTSRIPGAALTAWLCGLTLPDFERAVKAADSQNTVSYLKNGETYRFTLKAR